MLEFHYGIALNKEQTLCWACPQPDCNDISMYAFRNGNWYREKDYPKNPYPLIQLACSHDENFVIGSFKAGFLLWNIAVVDNSDTDDGCTTLKLPSGVRNVPTKMNKSSPCVLSAKQTYAIAGIRKELFVWSVETGQLVIFFMKL